MPSLKDLKNRIDSVKSTRKITKAMQMVAAAKLRRAQEAAEMARPYAEKMEAVMGGLAQAVGQSESAPRLLAGTGSDQVHLLVVMTAERGLCGGFNSSIVRLARQRIDSLKAEGKTVKILTVGKKGREQLKRDHADLFVGHVDLSEVKRIGYANAADIATDLLDRFDAGEFDVATIFFNRFQSVISQVPTATQVIPAAFEAAEEDDEGGHALRLRTVRRGRSGRPSAARCGDADLHRASGKRRIRAGRADVRDGQRDPQCRRNDRPPDHRVQPLASGRHYQRADRNHLGRRSALRTGDTTHG
jgi:F-type H+-transporting ATPase subunit gamma